MEGKEIAKKIIYLLGIIISYLGYFLGLSPVIEEKLSRYYRGLFDGGVVTMTLIATIFYVDYYFRTSKPAQETENAPTNTPRSTLEKPRTPKVEPKFVQEMIKRLENVDHIFNQVIERAGELDAFHPLRVRIKQVEETEFKQNMNWLAENYPQIAGETKKVMRQQYFDPITGVHVKDYDPILQIIQHDSIGAIISQRKYFVQEFRQNIQGGRARLLAYLGHVKKNR